MVPALNPFTLPPPTFCDHLQTKVEDKQISYQIAVLQRDQAEHLHELCYSACILNAQRSNLIFNEMQHPERAKCLCDQGIPQKSLKLFTDSLLLAKQSFNLYLLKYNTVRDYQREPIAAITERQFQETQRNIQKLIQISFFDRDLN